jgi:uncharacterized protein
MQNFFDQKMKFLSALALISLTFFLFIAGATSVADIKIRTKAINPTNTITFRGTAEIKTVPDVAIFTITIRETEKDVLAAQQKMTEKNNKLVALLQENGVQKNDIQSTNYSTYPKYIYEQQPCVNGVCPAGKQVLEGYEASQTITAKLRNLEKSGETLSKISALEIYEISGPNFSVEDPQKFKSQAQAEAITKAKKDAEITAKNLGVKLKKIIRFYEEPLRSFGGVRPMMMAKGMAMDSNIEMAAPQLEAGEEKISTAVSITYEIE